MTFSPALHGLRGVAVLIVLLSHWGNAGHRLLPFPHDAIGKTGVWVFFALSAYLLTVRLRENRKLLPYAVNRIARIMPLYLVFIGLHVALGDIQVRNALRHVAMIEAWQEAWAIPIEASYYFLLPLVALSPRWLGTAIAGIAICAAMLAPPTDVFGHGLSILSRLAPFALGSLAALWHPRIGSGWRMAAVVGMGTAIVAYREQWGDPRALSLLLGFTAAGLILACNQAGSIARFFSLAPLVWLGKVSFSVYLLHMFAMRFIPHPWIALGATLAVSAITYRFIEVPAMRLGRGVFQRAPSDAYVVSKPRGINAGG